MASEHSSHKSNKSSEKFEQPIAEDATEGHGAQVPEHSAIQETSEDKPEATSPDETLGWARLLIIGVGLWFAVFLYSIVSL
jgi:hypothetical protein